jgi:hypothetical protein
MNDKTPPVSANVPPARSGRGKYITLAVLVAWVIGVFVVTMFKFSGGAK